MAKALGTSSAGWQPAAELNDGRRIPLLGAGAQYGYSEDGNARGDAALTPDYVDLALSAGFRLIDTARCYGTEAGVAEGIRRSGVPRDEIYVVSKAWPGLDHEPGYAASRAAIAESVERLGGPVDLYLVHHPVEGWRELWRALEDAREDGLVHSIGVSNFRPADLDELASFARIPPAANEIHLHPFVHRDQRPTLEACRARGIHVIGFPRSPWCQAAGTAVAEVAEEIGRTPAQVVLRWGVEHRVTVIPLSTDRAHLAQNFAVRDFMLSPSALERIDAALDQRPFVLHVDVADRERVAGWVIARAGLAAVLVIVDGVTVGEAAVGLTRPDVADAYPEERFAGTSGFELRFGADGAPGVPQRIELEFVDQRGRRERTAQHSVSA